MKRALAIFAAALLGLALSQGTSQAAVIAYDNAAVAPNQSFGNSLGLDFDVNQSITVSALGAFFGDNLANLTSKNDAGVEVGIYDRNTQTLVAPSVFINPGSDDFIVNGDAFMNVAPFTLAPGQYSIVAFNDPNYNSFGGPNVTSTMNDGGSLISFVGARYDFGTSYPLIVDGPPANRYDAGTFQFDAAAVPEPGSLALAGMGIVGLAAYGRRRRAQVAV